jgi:hypothetical protein
MPPARGPGRAAELHAQLAGGDPILRELQERVAVEYFDPLCD